MGFRFQVSGWAPRSPGLAMDNLAQKHFLESYKNSKQGTRYPKLET
jgi:hypothetical protein